MAQADNFPSVTAKDLLRIPSSLYGIFGDKVDLGQTVLSPHTHTHIHTHTHTHTPHTHTHTPHTHTHTTHTHTRTHTLSLSLSLCNFPVSVFFHQGSLLNISSIYSRRCIILANDSFVIKNTFLSLPKYLHTTLLFFRFF
jgi:hypothetical protein